VPLVEHFIAPFMVRCADMVCEALKLGVPLRGALAVGPAVMHSRTVTFVGAPLVEAARLEQSQDWLGVSLGDSMLAADVSREPGTRAARSSEILFVPCEDIFPSVLRSQGAVVDTVGCKDGVPGIVIRMEFVRLAKFREFGFHFGYMFL